jgi:hypothetical protein
MDLVSIVGLVASLLVLVSFIMKDIRHLRILNSLGCAAFICYGTMLSPIAWPIVLTNAAIVAINVYYLSKGARKS